jgi:flagellar biosynthesis/type III secretory pathway chaperone
MGRPADGELVQALAAEHGSLSAFVRVLREEQETLAEGGLDALPALAEEKLKLAGEVSAHAQARRGRVLGLGHSADRAGMELCLQQHAPRACADLWREIIALAETGRALNETNGVLVERQLAQSRQALAVLHSASGAGGLYDRDGQARPQGATRDYGAA